MLIEGAIALLILFLSLVTYRRRYVLKKPARYPVKLLVTMGSGGHTAELLTLLSALDKNMFSPRHYVIASSDQLSLSRVEGFEREHKDYYVHRIPRSRSVGQSYITSIFTTIYSAIWTLPLVLKVWPQLIIVNGPGTCVPVCLIAFCLGVCRSVFVESVCRVKTLSLSGLILYNIVDKFYVQWPELAKLYPRTCYLGRLV